MSKRKGTLIDIPDIIDSMQNAMDALDSLHVHLSMGGKINLDDKQLLIETERFVQKWKDIARQYVEGQIEKGGARAWTS